MKNLIYLLVLFLVLSNNSCSKDEVFIENNQTIQSTVENLKILHINQVGNKNLKDKLDYTIDNLKIILQENYSHIYQDHVLKDLTVDISAIFWSKEDDYKESFTFLLTIPHNSKEDKLNMYSYLTLNFDDGVNLLNELTFGYYYDFTLSFDSNGKTIPSELYNRYYTPKPSYIPAKAPKSVICNYFRQNGNWPLGLSGYCGIGIGTPIPYPGGIEALNELLYGNVSNFTQSTNNLYILSPNHPDGQYPFSLYSNNQYTIKNEIISFYHKVYVPQLNNTVYAANLNMAWHIHKQAFIDSYFQWAGQLSYNVRMYLYYNPQVLKDIFNIFADYNLPNNPSEGVYLGVQWGQYSPNQNLSRLTKAGNHLLTAAGYSLIQQYGSGAISNQDFRNILNAL